MKKNPSFMEFPFKDYEHIFQPNTVLVYRTLVDPDITYENGRVKERYLNDSFVEIRRVAGCPRDMLYIYCTDNHHFYSTDSLDEAYKIFNYELKEANAFVARVNRGKKRESLKKIKDHLQVAA